MPPRPPPEPLYVLRGHRAAVQCVAFLPGCSALAAGDGEGELKLWDLDSRRVTASIRAHDSHSGLLQVACPATTNSSSSSSSSSPYIVSQGRDGVVKCWDVHSGSSLSSQPVHTLAAGSYNFCRFALLQQGQQSSSCSIAGLAQPSRDGSNAAQHDMAVVEGFAPPSNSAVAAAAAAPPSALTTGQQQHSAGGSGLLSQQLAKTNQQQQQQQQHQQQEQEQLDTLSGHSDLAGSAVADLSELGFAAMPDLTEQAEESLMQRARLAPAAVPAAQNAEGAAPAVGNGPCLLALPAADAADIGIWQLGQQGSSSSSSRPSVLLSQQRSQERPRHGLCMAVSLVQPQGCALHAVAGYEDGSVALWDARQPKQPLASAKLHSEAVMCVAVSPDCTSGFSGSADKYVTSFKLNIPTGQLQPSRQAELPDPGVADVAVRADGKIVASAGWDGKVRVWHARKWQPLALLRWHSQQVACVQFSGDCQLLAAGGRDSHISMWSIYAPGSPGQDCG